MADKKDAKTPKTPKTPKSQAKLEEEEELKTAPNFTQRRRIVSSKTHNKVTLREFENVRDIDGAVILEGFPTTGMSCALATNFLLKKLKLPQVADITSDEFPITGVVSGFAAGTGIRIYGNKQICVVVCDFSLAEAADEVISSLVSCLLDFAACHNAKLVITADGLAKDKKGGVSLGGEGEGEEDEEGGMSIDLNDLNSDDEEEQKKKKEKKRKQREAEKKKKAKHAKDAKDGKDDKTEEKKDEKKDPKSEKKKHFGPRVKLDIEDGDDEDAEDDDDEEDDKVMFATNEQKIGDQIRAMGFDPLKECVLHGVTGGILAELQTSPLPVVALISSTAPKSLTDARNSVEILKIITTLAGLPALEPTSLVADVKKIEKQLTKVITALRKGMDKTKDHQKTMYM